MAGEQKQTTTDLLQRLQRITAALSPLITPGDVARIVLDQLGPDVGAMPLLWLWNEDTQVLELVDPERHRPAADFVKIPLDSPLPGGVAARTRRAVCVNSRAEREAQFPELTSLPTDSAFVTLPLANEARLTGVLAVAYPGPHAFDADELAFLGAVADVTTAAFERARLQQAQTKTTARLEFLASASELLAGSLDYEDTLRRIVRLMVPRVAEMATIHLYDDERVLQRVALAHVNPSIEAALLAYVEAHESEARNQTLAAAAAGGAVLVVPDAKPIVAEQAAIDAQHARLIESLDITSGIVEPLVARGETLGVLTFLRVGAASPYGPDDVSLATDLARRAAIAVDNARLHARGAHVAHLLQASLLPPELPDIEGVELAAAFHAAGEGIEVGGDFYDVFALPDGRSAFVIGDVTGTGPAAAALTAQVRYTARAFAAAGASPAAVVAAVNDLLVAGMDPERFCTMVFAAAAVTPAGLDVEIVNAGHPQPILVTADQAPRAVDVLGSLLAVLPGATYTSSHITLARGDALVLYTDGVIENRAAGQGDFFDEEGVLTTLHGRPGRHASELVATLEGALEDFTAGRFSDDVAILVVQAR